MAVATLPPPVDIDNDTKKAIIDGLKRVLAVFQEAGHLPADIVYQHLIADPGLLTAFVQCFNDHRDLADSIVRPHEGDGPVRDDDQMLACQVSLNQIQQLLVRTCAKKVFEGERARETVTETVTRKSFLFFKKTEQVEVQRTADPVEERKIREITRYVAFAWQLPLLAAYRDHLTYPQLIEIGEDLVALRRAEDVAALGQYEPAVLKKVKQSTGPDFAEILAHRPHAIGGIAIWNKDMYEFIHKTLGDKAWTFFARDANFFNVVAAMDKATIKVFGDILCYISASNLEEFQRMNIDKCEVLAIALRNAFGDKLPLVLRVPNFGKEVLRKVVDNLLHATQDKDKLIVAYSLTCKSMVPAVLEWLARQPQAR